MSESYDVDPDGDLKIVLSLSTSPFAQWKGDQELSPDDSNADANDIKDAHLAAEDSLLGSTPCQPIELRLKVSSKHLTLASRRFKKMLGGNWLEARTVHPDGCRHVNMEYFDPAALKILMDIIHGRTRKVPRSVELELLAKIAVLVDDLECYEEVEVFSELWLGELKHSTPDDLSRDLVLWILISIVFRQLDLFQRTTRTAIMCGTGPFESLELPIPKSVIDEIDNNRQEAIEKLLTVFHNVFDNLRDDETACTFECNSMLLGAFVKDMPQYLLWPRPSRPFTGLSFIQISRIVHHLRSLHWYSEPRVDDVDGIVYLEAEQPFTNKKKRKARRSAWDVEDPGFVEAHQCTLQAYLAPEVDLLEASMQGLELKIACLESL